MHTLTLKTRTWVHIVILLLLALFIWGIGLETLKRVRSICCISGQRHLMLVFTSMFFAFAWSVSRAKVLLSRPAAKGFAEYVIQMQCW